MSELSDLLKRKDRARNRIRNQHVPAGEEEDKIFFYENEYLRCVVSINDLSARLGSPQKK